MVALPYIGRLFGIESMSLTRIPFLGEIIRDYIHMGTFGHPLLIIIMYMGALNPKLPNVNKLMSIRKELSIISGSAVFTHSLIRVVNNLPDSFKFFTDNAGYMAETKVASELGAGISSFSFILGIIMLIIFIPLWVTSFDGVRRRMGYTKWKKFQKWSYVLYATLFIHAMGIQIGGMLNPRGGHASRPATVETVAQNQTNRGKEANTATDDKVGRNGRNSESTQQTPGSGQGRNREGAKPAESGRQGGQVTPPATNSRMPSKGFSDIQVSAEAKRYINISSLLLIYGSYLYLRLRKSRKDAEKKAKRVQPLS